MRQFHNEPDAEGVVRLASEYILGTYNDSASHLDTVKVWNGLCKHLAHFGNLHPEPLSPTLKGQSIDRDRANK